MPKVKTQIVPIGTHFPPDGVPFHVTAQRARTWVDKFNAVKKDGNRIPVSWGHHPSANPSAPTDQAFTASKYNAGYVDDLLFDPQFKDAKGVVTPSLVGVLDVPGATVDDQGNLLAQVELPGVGNVKTAIGEVSGAFDSWTDGQKRTWEDLLVHVALTPLPVVAGQKGFQAVPDPKPLTQTRLSLSTLAYKQLATGDPAVADTPAADTLPETPPAKPPETDDRGAMLDRIKKCLAETYGIKVPDATTEDEFLEDLDVALQAAEHAKSHAEGGGETKPVAETTTTPPLAEESHAVTMSTLAAKSDNALLRSLVLEKETNLRTGLLARIGALRKRGLSKARADAMEQDVTRVQLSILPDGKVPITKLEEMIKLLEEQLPHPEYTRSSLATATEQPQPETGGGISNERADQLADQLGKHIGIRPGTNGTAPVETPRAFVGRR